MQYLITHPEALKAMFYFIMGVLLPVVIYSQRGE